MRVYIEYVKDAPSLGPYFQFQRKLNTDSIGYKVCNDENRPISVLLVEKKIVLVKTVTNK